MILIYFILMMFIVLIIVILVSIPVPDNMLNLLDDRVYLKVWRA
jgi:hypothetical protein